jgi:hypothetical protein
MNGEFERIWKDAVVAHWRYYPDIFPDRPKKTMENLNQVSRCPDIDSDRASPELNSRALPLSQLLR